MADYTARSSVILNGQQAEDQLEKLSKRAKDLREEMKKLRQANDLAGFREKDKELKEVNKEMRQMRKETFSVENVLKNLSGASLKEISTAARKASSELKAMKQSDPGYADKAGQVKLLNNKMRELSSLTRSQQSLWGRLADDFNKYQTIGMAAMASFAAVALTVKSTVTAFAQFDDKLSDVIKTTNLTKDEVKALNSELEKIDTRTSQEELLQLARIAGKLNIKNQDDILGFVRAADKINVALAEDLGGNTEEAIKQVGKLVDIFKLKQQFGIEDALLKVGSAINSLGASGTANEEYMVEFSKRVAGIAPSAGISIQKVLGLAATLDELGQTSEVSSTAIVQVIGKMFKDTATYARIAGMELNEFTTLLNTDANEAFIKLLEGAKGSGAGFSEMAKNLQGLGLDGARSTAVLGVLAGNIDKLREKQAFSNQEFAKGTSLLIEFNTKNENAQAKLEKARKSFDEMQRELGERLTPAYTSIIKKSSLLLKTLGITVEFIYNNRKALIITTTTIVSYTVAVKLMTLWESRKNKETALGLVLSKAKVIVHKAEQAALLLAAAAQALLTGNITRATAAMRLFNTTTKLNPIGLLVSLLTIAATSFLLFRDKSKEAQLGQKELNEEIQKGNELLGQSKTLTERASIIKNLNRQQLETLKSDLQNQVSEEENFHATLLQKLKKRLDEDAKLKELNALRSQAGLSEIQKINLNAQVHARKTALARELEEENKTSQQRLNNLKNHLVNVNAELKKHPVEPIPGLVDESDINSQSEKLNLANLLEADIESQNDAIRKYFNDAGEGAFEAFMAAIEKSRKSNSIDFSIVPAKTDEKETENPVVDYGIQKYQETLDFKLALNQSMYEQGLIGEQQYQDRLTELTKQAEDERYEIKRENSEKAWALASMAASFVGTLMDLELEKAGENEEQKKQIRKKYADLNFAVTSAQIIADTAGAIMEGYRQLGPIGGTIAAVLLGATGMLQLSVANAQRQKAKSFATGKYPDIEFAGRPQTGMYGDKPQLGIFNEVPGQPETVIDGITTRNININYPEIMRAIYAVRDGRVPEFAAGKYPSFPATSNSVADGEKVPDHFGNPPSAEITALLKANLAMMNELKNIRPVVAIETIERERSKYIQIKQTRGL